MLLLILTFIAGLALSLALTYVVRGWAFSAGLLDWPDGVRRLHSAPVPRVGGIAVFATVAIIVGAVFALDASRLVGRQGTLHPVLVLAAGGAAVFLIGLWDDIRGLSARTKFLLEALLAALVFLAGVRFESIGLVGGEVFAFPVWASLALTVVWLVGITNAFNLIDGSDGLAAGAALFAAGTMAVVSLWNGQDLGAVLGLALAGATLGFLFFNFPPASIFLGDCGSLFLGFILAGLGLVTAQKAPTAVAVAIPVVSFGLPILDTGLAIVRRYLRRQPIFNPDRGHIHHRLRELGHSPRRIALLLYAACGGFSLLSLLLIEPAATGSGATMAMVVAGTAVGLAVQRLGIPELLELKRALVRGLKQRDVFAHNVRIREAVVRLEAATDAAEILRAVRFAFQNGEFERVELWLGEELGYPLEGQPGVKQQGPGYVWSFCASRPDSSLPSPDSWAIHFQFKDDAGLPSRAVGHLALWHGADRPHLLTDVNLIASAFQPALHEAILRVRGPRREIRSPVLVGLVGQGV